VRPWLIAIACALVAAGPAAANVTSEPVGTFDRPTQVTAPPDDVARLFVVEQGGVVRAVVNGAVQATPFLDISDIVLSPRDDPDDSRGMYSIAFAPDYAESGRFYADFVDEDGQVEVAEFRRSSGDPNVADPASRRLVLTIPYPNRQVHYGGQLAFDAAGSLYVSTGDGTSGGDPTDDDAQSLTSLFGKILRIRPFQSGSSPYTVPAGNPFPGRPDALPEIWAYGLRNPFRFSLDRMTGDLTIGDVGQGSFEEVNFAPRYLGTGAGDNFGWAACEGRSEYPIPPEPTPCTLTGHTPPVHVIDHTNGACSVIGGFVVRDASLAELFGRYVFGDFCKGELRQLRLKRPDATDDGPVGTPGVEYIRLQSLGEDACGRIYSAEQSGQVERLVDGSTSCTIAIGLPPAPPAPPGPADPTRAETRVPPAHGRASDRRAPRVGVRVVGGLRGRGLVVRVRCSEACSLRALGRLSLHKLRLRGARSSIAAHRVKVLRLRPSRAGRAALRRALRRRKRVRARVVVRAWDRSGNLSRRSLLVRSRR
jgi:glucose/arabinose dehydrogenase